MHENAKNNQPIILGNAPSTGSGLLRVLLSRHPRISSGGEMSLMVCPELFQITPATYRNNISKWLRTGVPFVRYPSSTPRKIFTHLDEYPWNRKALDILCRNAESFPDLLREVELECIRYFGGERWLEKSPDNVFSFQEIQRVFPGARLIHIVRDGRDSVASLLRRGYHPFAAVTRWFLGTLVGIQYRESPQYYELRYEDLVQNPEAELLDLLEFLHEPFSPDLLIGSEGGPDPIMPTWKNNRLGPITATSVGCHREELTSQAIHYFQAIRLSPSGLRLLPHPKKELLTLTPLDLLQDLGYSAEVANRRVKGRRAFHREVQRTVFRARLEAAKECRRFLRCPTRLGPT